MLMECNGNLLYERVPAFYRVMQAFPNVRKMQLRKFLDRVELAPGMVASGASEAGRQFGCCLLSGATWVPDEPCLSFVQFGPELDDAKNFTPPPLQ
jgi:hypothetical protein